jgi:tetratricopeptide (TPR) repeat protein
VTSRGSLGALAAHHAVRSIDLGLLDAGEAFELLCRVLGPERVAAEPDAARRLGELCGRMPLALRIAAARLASQPRLTLAEFGDALASTGRLDALAAEGDSRSVRTVFASVYGGLAPEAARLFRLAGLHPGRTIGPDLAAALTGGFPTEAGRILAELAASHLLTRVSDGRYGFHDLIRLYAQERVRAEDGTQACADAEDRLLDWYLAIAAAAHSALGRDDGVDVHLTYPPAGLPFGSDAQDALDFLAAERDNLVPVGQFASAHGRVVHGWQLPHLLTGYYDFRGDCEDRVALARSGVDGARQSGDQRTEALLRKALGVAYINTRRFADALDELGRARALARAAGDRRGEANICNNVAVAHAEERRFAEAIAAFGEALAGYTETGHRTGMAMALSNIGEAQLSAGRPERSAAPLEEALRLARELENPWLEGRVLTTIGQAHARQGRPAEALAWLSESLEVRRRIGARRHELDTLNEIGSVRLAIGEPALAVRELHEALVIGREIGDPHVEAVTLHNLGRAYLACGDRALAREYASLAAETRARVPDAFESAAISETLRAI